MILTKELFAKIADDDLVMSIVVLKQLGNGGVLLSGTEKYIQGESSVGDGLKQFVKTVKDSVGKKSGAQKEYIDFVSTIKSSKPWKKIVDADPKDLRDAINKAFETH